MVKASEHVAKGEVAVLCSVLRRSHMHTSSQANREGCGRVVCVGLTVLTPVPSLYA